MTCDAANVGTINKKIDELSTTGGILKIAPCRIPVNSEIRLKSNVTLQGSGVGITTLAYVPEMHSDAETLIRVEGSPKDKIRHVVLRDFTISGPGSGPVLVQLNNIRIEHADNFLAERLTTSYAGKTGLTFRWSQNVTVRYVTSHGSLQWYGISTKDCYVGEWMDGSDADTMVSRDECARGIEDYWTDGVLLHSNYSFNNRGLGINSHASNVEIAGNLMDYNGSAAKFTEPASNLWIHHNQFSNSDREGMKIANARLADSTLITNSHFYFNNVFKNNTDYGVRIHERAWNLLFSGNQYLQNGEDNKLRVKPGKGNTKRLSVCPNDSVTRHGVDGHLNVIRFLDASDNDCRFD